MAFYNCDGLTSITIPDSVTSIGEYTFYHCKGLTSVTIPDSVTSISDWAFGNCYGLTSVTIPDSVTSIGYCAFSQCNNIATTYYTGTLEQWGNISIDSSNSAISKNIVFECNSERPYYGKGTCGDNLTWTLYTDGELVIDGTDDMTDYSSDSNVSWYSKRLKIKSATIGNSITSIGDYAFYDCDGLTSITIPDSVTSIGDYAFYYCTGLTSITIPDSVTSIGEHAFFGCYKLTSIAIPDSVTSIGDYAFAWCDSLTNITIPDSVTSIGDSAFYGCTSLTDVYYAGSEADWNKITISGSNDSLINANIHFNYVNDSNVTEEPVVDDEVVKNPSTASIAYGDSIVLHVDPSKIPEGGYVEWTASNGNFDMSVSADGTTCTVSPKSSGKTVFTATVYDKDGNVISSDTQEMTAKAGLWQKIVAFFKKIFGLTKTIPEAFKGIF